MMVGLLAAAYITQIAGARAGVGWTLYGTVTNAATCNIIVGAKISSPYNNYAYNISNTKGQYSITLGQGSWQVAVSAAGYNNGSYTTPYYTTGAWEHNFSLIPVGGSARSPPCSSNTTVITSTSVATTTALSNVTTYSTTTPPTTSSVPPTSSSFSASDAAIVVIVIIIIVVAVILIARGGKKTTHTHHG